MSRLEPRMFGQYTLTNCKTKWKIIAMDMKTTPSLPAYYRLD